MFIIDPVHKKGLNEVGAYLKCMLEILTVLFILISFYSLDMHYVFKFI